MYKLIKNDGTDLTNRVLDITWKSNLDQLGDQLDFSLFQPSTNFTKISLNNGDIVVFNNDNEELFRGIVVSNTQNNRNTITYTCFDYAFYLNKNQRIYQFNDTASKVLISICRDYNIPVGNIINIPTRIKKIYTSDIASTIRDIISIAESEQNKKYYFEMSKGKFYVKEKGSYLVSAKTSLFGSESDITNFISNPSRKVSIENMKNSIQIITGNDEQTKVVTEVKNQSYINKFGLLQQIQSIDEKELAKAKNIASNLLNELCKESEELSLQLIGNDKVRAGVSLEINETITGAKGTYLVKDCTHTIKNGIHTMALSLER
ncbi:MAG: hypothetical protein AB6733_10740 [Clostridiaceae bacterium]